MKLVQVAVSMLLRRLGTICTSQQLRSGAHSGDWALKTEMGLSG